MSASSDFPLRQSRSTPSATSGVASHTSRQLRSVSAPFSHITISLMAKALGAMLIASAVNAPARLATMSPASVNSAIPPVRPAIAASSAIAPPAPIKANAGRSHGEAA